MDLLEGLGEGASSSHVVEKDDLVTSRKDWMEEQSAMPEDAKKMSQTNLNKWRLKAGKTEVDDDERIPEGWKSQADAEVSIGGPSHHIGVGAPLQQINTCAWVSTDKAVPTGWKSDDEKVPEGWKSQTDATGCIGGPSHHVGVGAPLHQINTRACVSIDKAVPSGWKKKRGKLSKKEVREMEHREPTWRGSRQRCRFGIT